MKSAMSDAPASPEPGSARYVAASKPGVPDYELVAIVGRGSYGDVWLARSVTGAWRAIKIVWRERFTNSEPFEREFRGLKEFADVSLGESSQMILLHVGRNDAAGFFYYVMELADDAERGRQVDPVTYVPLTLAEMRARRGRIAAHECARFGTELARSLASLHRRGLVHRDVKPSNVILVNGVPKLADVGLVAAVGSAHTFVGTEGYVPPEGPGAPSADVFALGKLLYELSSGHDQREFPKLPADLVRLPDRSALLELNEIILCACAPAATRRYRDGAAILADLTALNTGVSLRTRRVARFGLRAAAAITLVAGLGAGVWRWQTHPGPPSPRIAVGATVNAVAVLPFVNATGDADQEYFVDGISDEILHALERERELHVTGSASAFWFKDRALPNVEIAKALRVSHLVEGSLRRVGTRIRADVRLTRGADGASETAGTFEREADDIFALEDEVARAIANRLLSRVDMLPLLPSTKNPQAYDAFLRGRALQARGAEHASAAVGHYERAVGLDREFAVAWARLADALRTAGMRENLTTWTDSARLAADRAVDLQPDLALGWCVRGFVRSTGQQEFGEGLRDLARAEELGGATAETLMTRLMVMWGAGESRGLLSLAREALARNPENIERLGSLPLAMEILGDYPEADRLYQQAIVRAAPGQSGGPFGARVRLRLKWRGAEAALRLVERAPPEQPGALTMRVYMLAAAGRAADAAKLLENAKPAPGVWSMYADAGLEDRARELAAAALSAARERWESIKRTLVQRTDNDRVLRTNTRSNLAAIEIILGHRAAALALLDEWRQEQEQLSPNRRSGGTGNKLPAYYAALGEHEVAIALLRRTLTDGVSLGYDLRDTPAFAGMRDDPRFLELRRQAEAWAASRPDPPDDPP